ncbi:O-antigen ligase family protein [Candidatus Microgenomates bacterium]|nr:O-antigen ligase family protein [Candidatus Microgenomates bacterium]
MKESINTYLSLIFKIGVVSVILSTFFLFTNLTTDFYDTPKFIVLLIFTAIILILLTIKFTLSGKVVLIRTPLDLPLLLLLVVVIISTFLSPAPYVSLLGNQVRIHGSLVAIAVYVLFYFLLVNNLRSLREIKFINLVLTGSGGVLAAVTLLSYFGVRLLPSPWNVGPNFTPTGSSFSTSAVLVLLIPLVVLQIISEKSFAPKHLASKLYHIVLLTTFGVTVALVGSWATYIAAILGVAAVLYLNRDVLETSLRGLTGLIGLIIPAVVVLAVVLLSFVPIPVQTPLAERAKNFPREIQLPFVTSWKVSVSAFRDNPFWGSGPSTYLFNFTSYKPVEFNQYKFWNIRFDTAFNEYLQVLATLGGVGLVALLSLTAMFINMAARVLRLPHAYAGPAHKLAQALAVSGLTFFLILLLHPSTLTLWVGGLLILAIFCALNLMTSGNPSLNREGVGGNLKQVFMRLASNISQTGTSEETVRVDALPGILLVISLAAVLSAFFFGGKLVLADFHHRKALDAVLQNQGVVAYNDLVRAEQLNPVSDLYRTDLAQVNFALANAIALAKAPSEASPAGSLTDQDKQNIQVLLQQSINEGRTAVSLSPRSAINWEILATLYRQIAGVAENALIFSLDSYGRAIFQDPLNPLLRLYVGGTYYAVQNYDLAVRFFTDSINLKPDFANGYYNLSVALRDRGDLNAALQAAERMITFVEASSADYQVAQDYLNDLKNRISPPNPPQPPAATASGALQEEGLPKVVDVGQPPAKIATPEAIKRPSPTPSPQP